MAPQSSTHNVTLVLTLALAMGVMSFDQGSVGYLLPFIKPDFQLTNTHVGIIASTYWIAFAVASYGIGILVDARGIMRKCLVMVLGAFALSSLLSGFVGGVQSLLLARAVMGLLAGALLTLVQSVLGLSSPPERVGTNMGLVTGLGGSLCGLIFAPLILVRIASAFGWRTGFFAIALPAILAAVLVARKIHEPRRSTASMIILASKYSVLSGLREASRFRNIWLCALLCSLYVAYLSLGFTFLPLFFVSARGFSLTQMSGLIAVLGFSSILFAIVLPALSNRFGRRPVLVLASATSILTPLAAYYFTGPVIILGALLFLGWSMSGTGSFFMGIIPSETVGTEILSRTLGSVIALGVLMGGLAGPIVAGWSADRWGTGAPLLVQATCAVLAALASMALRETAPKFLKRRDARSPIATETAN